MIKMDELKGPSCLTNAKEDEPLFVLRANDELAPFIVRQWTAAYLAKHVRANTLTEARKAKGEEAIRLAFFMEEWKESHS